MIGVIAGALQLIWWLGAVWFRHEDLVPLSVQPFEVSHGSKIDKEEGKHLTTHFVRQLRRIHGIMAADLSALGDADQVRIESVAPKNLNLAPDVPLKIDIEVKAFDIDVIGIFERVYRFFDRSDRMQATIWVGDKVKVFASFNSENDQRTIGPWWVDQVDQLTAVDKIANLFALDLYKTRVRGLDGMDDTSFAMFVEALGGYQDYVRKRHAEPKKSHAEILNHAGDLLQKLADDDKKASAIVYAYLGSVRSIQDNTEAAVVAYEKAVSLNAADTPAARALKRLRDAKALQPVAVEAPAGPALEALRSQGLRGYDAKAVLVPRGDITIAILSTGVSSQLSKLLGPRLVRSLSVVDQEPETDDKNGHGTAVTSLTAALAPSAKIISIKTISASGSSGTAVIALGIRAAVKEKANILLLPLSSRGSSKDIEDAIKDARDAGAIVVAAAGNEPSGQVQFPAALPGVVAMGSTDSQDQIARFSARGPNVLYAPGVDILVLQADEKIATRSGTSFSAAVGAAIAAVIWATKPDQSAAKVIQRLTNSAIDLGPVDAKNEALGKIRRIDLVAASRDER